MGRLPKEVAEAMAYENLRQAKELLIILLVTGYTVEESKSLVNQVDMELRKEADYWNVKSKWYKNAMDNLNSWYGEYHWSKFPILSKEFGILT